MTQDSNCRSGPDTPDRGRCPNCRRAPVPEYRPFCSKRCADIDLGRWLDGKYAIPGEPATGLSRDTDGESDS